MTTFFTEILIDRKLGSCNLEILVYLKLGEAENVEKKYLLQRRKPTDKINSNFF